MKVKIEIDTENDAFQNGNCGSEIKRILDYISDRIQHFDSLDDLGGFRLALHDVNGNKVGRLICSKQF